MAKTMKFYKVVLICDENGDFVKSSVHYAYKDDTINMQRPKNYINGSEDFDSLQTEDRETIINNAVNTVKIKEGIE